MIRRPRISPATIRILRGPVGSLGPVDAGAFGDWLSELSLLGLGLLGRRRFGRLEFIEGSSLGSGAAWAISGGSGYYSRKPRNVVNYDLRPNRRRGKGAGFLK